MSTLLSIRLILAPGARKAHGLIFLDLNKGSRMPRCGYLHDCGSMEVDMGVVSDRQRGL